MRLERLCGLILLCSVAQAQPLPQAPIKRVKALPASAPALPPPIFDPGHPQIIKKIKRAAQVELGRGLRISRPGAKARKRRLRDHLAPFDAYLISFWATWCVPCVSDEELEALEALRVQLRPHKVALLSLAVDELSKVQEHPKAKRWLYPLWQKVDGHLEMLPRAFIQRTGLGLPLHLLVNKEGEIRFFHNQKLSPDSSWELLEAAKHLVRE